MELHLQSLILTRMAQGQLHFNYKNFKLHSYL